MADWEADLAEHHHPFYYLSSPLPTCRLQDWLPPFILFRPTSFIWCTPIWTIPILPTRFVIITDCGHVGIAMSNRIKRKLPLPLGCCPPILRHNVVSSDVRKTWTHHQCRHVLAWVFVFWEEGGGVAVVYAAKYFADGVQRFAGLVLVTIVVFSGEDKGWAPLVFAIEIGMAMDGVSEVNVYKRCGQWAEWNWAGESNKDKALPCDVTRNVNNSTWRAQRARLY